MSEPVLLWQAGPVWGLPSASPFCIKLEAWLRMAAVPYEVRVLRRPPRSASGKVPYVELPGGRILCDSGAIIEALTAEHGVTLDDGLDDRQRALAVAVTRMLEDHFYWAVVWDRWIVPEHWPLTRAAYFGWLPAPLRWLVPALARRDVRRAFHGQGFGRMPDDWIVARASRDLEALAVLVGDAEHVLDRPSSLDATVFGFLAAALRPPFDGPLQRGVAHHHGLVAFCNAFERRWLVAEGPDLD